MANEPEPFWGIGHRRLDTLAGSRFVFRHPDGQTLRLDLCDGWGRSAICGVRPIGGRNAALNALTCTLTAELADSPILVNAVYPGLTSAWPGVEPMGPARGRGRGLGPVGGDPARRRIDR